MRQLHYCTRQGAAPLLQFLHSMLLVCENSRCKWHRRMHTHISQGDNERRSCFFRARHVTQNTTFVTAIGQVPHGVMPPICSTPFSDCSCSKAGRANSASKGAAAFKSARSRAVFSGWSSISASSVANAESLTANSTKYGSTEQFTLQARRGT